jgi:hypothetical protein
MTGRIWADFGGDGDEWSEWWDCKWTRGELVLGVFAAGAWACVSRRPRRCWGVARRGPISGRDLGASDPSQGVVGAWPSRLDGDGDGDGDAAGRRGGDGGHLLGTKGSDEGDEGDEGEGWDGERKAARKGEGILSRGERSGECGGGGGVGQELLGCWVCWRRCWGCSVPERAVSDNRSSWRDQGHPRLSLAARWPRHPFVSRVVQDSEWAGGVAQDTTDSGRISGASQDASQHRRLC